MMLRMPADSISSLDALLSAWKPINDAHRGNNRYSTGVHLRIYRCLSWAMKAERLDIESDADLVLILRIIGFNSLWGRSYEPGGQHIGEHKTWAEFLVALTQHDEMLQGRMARLFRGHTELFQAICESPFFHREFWAEPGAASLQENADIAERVRMRLKDGRTGTLLWEFTRRILLLRGQVVHGNATCGSSLNRDTVQAAGTALDLLLRTVLEVIILDGVHDQDLDWVPVPYDPGQELPGKST